HIRPSQAGGAAPYLLLPRRRRLHTLFSETGDRGLPAGPGARPAPSEGSSMTPDPPNLPFTSALLGPRAPRRPAAGAGDPAAGVTEACAGDPPTGLRKGDRIVFLGDSITQGGVAPKGYVTLIKNALAEQYKGLGLTVIGAGISGNKVPDLQRRLERDVLKKK